MTQPNHTAMLRMLVLVRGDVRTLIGSWGCSGVREGVRRLWHLGPLVWWHKWTARNALRIVRRVAA